MLAPFDFAQGVPSATRGTRVITQSGRAPAILRACHQPPGSGVPCRSPCSRCRCSSRAALPAASPRRRSRAASASCRWTSWPSAATGSRSPDLKPEEVSLKLGGRARPLTAINLIDVAPTGQAPAVSPLPPPFGTNVQTREARAFVLVVDDDSFRVGTERPLREAADTFLDKLAPTDRIALVTMPYGGTRVGLTTEQEAVRASLATIVGQAPARETPDDMACRSRRTLESLRGLFEGLIGSPFPVTVAFFSASMVGPNEQAIRSERSVATCALLPENFRQVGAAAADAGATALHHRAGRDGQPDRRPRQPGRRDRRRAPGPRRARRQRLHAHAARDLGVLSRRLRTGAVAAQWQRPARRAQGLAARRHGSCASGAAHRSCRRKGRAVPTGAAAADRDQARRADAGHRLRVAAERAAERQGGGARRTDRPGHAAHRGRRRPDRRERQAGGAGAVRSRRS